MPRISTFTASIDPSECPHCHKSHIRPLIEWQSAVGYFQTLDCQRRYRLRSPEDDRNEIARLMTHHRGD